MKTAVIVLTTLIVGLVAGVFLSRHITWHSETVEWRGKTPASAAIAPPAPANANNWDPFADMRRMQEQMDRMFNQSIQDLHSAPGLSGFADAPGYSLSLDMREFKDHFEVHAALPDAKASDVNVKLENDRTLNVAVSHRQSTDKNQGGASGSENEFAEYAQTIQLPAPVQMDKMKVDQKDHELVITLPKA